MWNVEMCASVTLSGNRSQPFFVTIFASIRRGIFHVQNHCELHHKLNDVSRFGLVWFPSRTALVDMRVR